VTFRPKTAARATAAPVEQSDSYYWGSSAASLKGRCHPMKRTTFVIVSKCPRQWCLERSLTVLPAASRLFGHGGRWFVHRGGNVQCFWGCLRLTYSQTSPKSAESKIHPVCNMWPLKHLPRRLIAFPISCVLLVKHTLDRWNACPDHHPTTAVPTKRYLVVWKSGYKTEVVVAEKYVWCLLWKCSSASLHGGVQRERSNSPLRWERRGHVAQTCCWERWVRKIEWLTCRVQFASLVPRRTAQHVGVEFWASCFSSQRA